MWKVEALIPAGPGEEFRSEEIEIVPWQGNTAGGVDLDLEKLPPGTRYLRVTKEYTTSRKRVLTL